MNRWADFEEFISYIVELIEDFPNYLKNVIIYYALQGTRLYATTFYEISKHTSQKEMDVYFKMNKK